MYTLSEKGQNVVKTKHLTIRLEVVNKQQYENIQSWPCLFTGPAAGWHLDYIDVKDEAMDQTFRFPCDRWLAKNDDDGETMRELACANNDSIDLSDKTSES